MNDLMRNFMKLSDPDRIFDLTHFQNIPIYAYSKNTKGTYLACNDASARAGGFTKGTDILDLDDFDATWVKEAPIVRENDEKVRLTGEPITFIEKARIFSGKMCRYVSLKAPLRGKSEKIIGIVGVSFFLDEVKPVAASFSDLSKQQAKCLYHLAKGMTMKEIGHVLELSPKTVEHYLDTVKMKLNCHSRSELIAYAINAGIFQ